MTDIIFEAVAMGVDSIVAGAVVSMIVTVLSLNGKLNAYTSLQETYADSVTYYRQYSKYNCTTIGAPDALSALLYYDERIDIVLVDVDIESTAKTADLYVKEDSEIKRYSFTVEPNGDGSYHYVKFGGSSVGAINTSTEPITRAAIIKVIRERYATTGMRGETYVEDNYADLSVRLSSTGKFKAYLLEDLARVPVIVNGDEVSGIYSGGVVTSIWLERIE